MTITPDTAHDIVNAIRSGDDLSRGCLPAHAGGNRPRRSALNAFRSVAHEARPRARGSTRRPPRRLAVAAAPRRARRAQGQPVHPRHGDHGRLANPRALRSAVQRYSRRAARRGRRGDRRQDQLRRVRDGIVDREFGVRSDEEPVGARSHAGRLERRIGRSRRGADGTARARLRHRRFDSTAGRALRRRRAQAYLRPGFALWPARVRLVTRSDRTICHVGGGRGAGAAGDRRRRSQGRDVRGIAGGRLSRRLSPATSPESESVFHARSSPRMPACIRRCAALSSGRSRHSAHRARSSSTSRSRTARTPSRSTISSLRRKRARTSRDTTASATGFAPMPQPSVKCTTARGMPALAPR